MLTHQDHIGRQIAAHGYYEKVMLNFIKDLKLKGTFIDVGANIGNHSVYFSKECNNFVCSFEPDLENFNLLQENTHDLNVYSYNIGLGSKQCRMGIEKHIDNMGMNRLIHGDEVDVLPLDIYEFKNISLIKIDVEGMEKEVLKGAKKTIEKNKPVLFIETNEPKLLLKLLPDGYVVRDRFNATPTYFFSYEANS